MEIKILIRIPVVCQVICRSSPSKNPSKIENRIRMRKSIQLIHFSSFILTSIKKSQEESHGQTLAIFLRFNKKFRLQLVVEFVADAPDGQNIFWRIRIWFNFFAQLADERHNIAVI